MCEDPIVGEPAALVVGLADDAAEADLRTAVDDAGGRVEEELSYGDYRVVVDEAAVDALCGALEGVATRVETADTLSLGLDEDAPDEFEG